MRYFLTDTCGIIYNKRVLGIHSISLSKDFLKHDWHLIWTIIWAVINVVFQSILSIIHQKIEEDNALAWIKKLYYW